MAWVKIDDQAPRHAKMLKAQPAACWLWVCGLAHCQSQLTDGFISDEVLPLIGVVNHARKLAGKLVAARLWQVVDGGYQVHDYLSFNTSRDDVLLQRARLAGLRADAGRRGGQAAGAQRRAAVLGKEATEHVATSKQTVKQVASVLLEAKRSPIPSHPIRSVEVPAELLRQSSRGQPPLAMNLKRLKFWRWMAEAMIAQLGPHADDFDLDAWIHERDDTETRVITGDWWGYWLPAFEAEVRRRGLPIVTEAPAAGKLTTRLVTAMANIAREGES